MAPNSNHSTATALIQVMDLWLEAAENTELSATLLLDQSAAYDLVDHIILLEKLKIYNFHDDSVEWFRSYLSQRSQIVQVESKLSKSCSTGGHAVPQGSILGGLILYFQMISLLAAKMVKVLCMWMMILRWSMTKIPKI